MKLYNQIDVKLDRPKVGKFLKRLKHKAERRRAKMDPECCPCYQRYAGYVS